MHTRTPLDETTIRASAQEDGVTHLATGIAAFRDGKLLLVRRAAHDFLGGNFELPGGGVDEGETIDESVRREFFEETGLTVREILGTFEGFDYVTDRKPKARQVNVLVTVEDGDVTLSPDEHDTFRWASPADYVDLPMSDKMRVTVECAFGAQS